MPSGPTAATQAKPARWKVEVVVNDDQILDLQLRQCRKRISTPIHMLLGLNQHRGSISHPPDPDSKAGRIEI
jgi:hypothetical protein